MAEVVRHGRLRWFGHVERKSEDDWVSACIKMWRWWGRKVRVGAGRLGECVKDDMDEFGLHPEWAVFRDVWRSFISGKTSDPC